MKKNFFSLIFLLMLFCLCSCNNSNISLTEYNEAGTGPEVKSIFRLDTFTSFPAKIFSNIYYFIRFSKQSLSDLF